MASPFRHSVGRTDQTYSTTQQSYPEPSPQGFGGITGGPQGIGPVVPSDQGSMGDSGGTSSLNAGPDGGQPTPTHRDVNMAILCRLGQETVQEIVSKTTELFQILKLLQPPNGTLQSMTGQEERKLKLQETLKAIAIMFKRLRKIYDIFTENSAELEYTHIDVHSLVPMKDEMDTKQEDRKVTEKLRYFNEEHKELVEQVRRKNKQLKEVIDALRNIMWEINTMLAMRKF